MCLVSIIIPTYNSCKTLHDTISSCLHQTYENIEIIIIDDGSTDKTKDVIMKFNDSRIRYYYYENSGRSRARNRGISLAKGEYIQFLDSDDKIEKNKIKNAMSILLADKTLDAIQCGTTYYKNDEVVQIWSAQCPKDFKKTIIRKNIFPIHSVVIKKNISHEFPTGLSYCEDWYYWVKTLYDANIYFDTEYYGAYVRIHENNTMSSYERMLWGELYVLLKLKSEIKEISVSRDLYLIKQYLNYIIKYDEFDMRRLTVESIEKWGPLKLFDCIYSFPGVKKCLQKYISKKFKNKKQSIY